jgi:vitamin B12 transporter
MFYRLEGTIRTASISAVAAAALLLTHPRSSHGQETTPPPSQPTTAPASEQTPEEAPQPAPAPADRSQQGQRVVVTANRIETPEREVGSSLTVIDAERIGRAQKTTVQEALRGTPGMDVVASGGPGGYSSLFVRGAPSEMTVVMVDGVEVADPMSTGRSYDMAHLMTGNIERIEVLRGPQSTLYGSDAMGGVVNIITRRGNGPLGGYALAEGGSFGTWRQSVWFGAGTELYDYSVGISHLKTDGISSAAERNGNDEEDGYRNVTVSGRFGLRPRPGTELGLIVRHLDTERDLDGWDYTFNRATDDLDHASDERQTFVRGQVTQKLFGDLWEQTLGVSSTEDRRDETNDQDNPDDNIIESKYVGRMLKVDWLHMLRPWEDNTLTMGYEYERERGEFEYSSTFMGFPFTENFPEEDAETHSFLVQDQIRVLDCLFLTAGARYDDHSTFGGETTWRGTAAWLIDRTGTKIKGSYGTGFKAPSLYQLYSSYGNRDLDPQESIGWDVGVEQSFWDERGSAGLTWFSNDFTNLIDYDFATSKYVNLGEVDTHGFELSGSVEPLRDLVLRGGYTYTHAEDRDTGEDLVRRPKNKYSAEASWLFMERRGDVTLGVDYSGDRPDVSDTTLASYTVVNLAASYQVSDRLRLFARVENLFDEQYEEVAGYGTPGIAAYLGVKISF